MTSTTPESLIKDEEGVGGGVVGADCRNKETETEAVEEDAAGVEEEEDDDDAVVAASISVVANRVPYSSSVSDRNSASSGQPH